MKPHLVFSCTDTQEGTQTCWNQNQVQFWFRGTVGDGVCVCVIGDLLLQLLTAGCGTSDCHLQDGRTGGRAGRLVASLRDTNIFFCLKKESKDYFVFC